MSADSGAGPVEMVTISLDVVVTQPLTLSVGVNGSTVQPIRVDNLNLPSL